LSLFCRALVDERDLLDEPLPLLEDFERLLDAFERLDELPPLPDDLDRLEELRLLLDLDLGLDLGLEPWLAISPPGT
jgi:hypothetical protein